MNQNPSFENSHFAIYSPGESTFTESTSTESWCSQINEVHNWLVFLDREITTPNKWDRLTKEIRGLSINLKGDEGTFSVAEYEDLRDKISYIKSKTDTIGVQQDQLAAINAKLDNLTEMAKQMNKFDWKSLFIGTIVNLTIQLSVTPENTTMLWSIIKSAFNNNLLP